MSLVGSPSILSLLQPLSPRFHRGFATGVKLVSAIGLNLADMSRSHMCFCINSIRDGTSIYYFDLTMITSDLTVVSKWCVDRSQCVQALVWPEGKDTLCP